MDSEEVNRRDYIARVNKVMDYIENHLDQNLNLNLLAEIARFSPFHFHRLFTILTRETLNTYIQRIRMERAAVLLQNNITLSISSIAFQTGFTNVSSFGRTFRIYFNTTPKKFRQQEKAVFVKNGVRYGKNGLLINRNINPNASPIYQLDESALEQVVFYNTKIEIKELPEMYLAYVRHTGNFDQIGKAYKKIMCWAAKKNLLDYPKTKVLTIYNDDPSITSIDKVRQDACITINKEIKTDEEIGKTKIAGGKYAVGHFEIKETEFEKAWNTVSLWLVEKGYSICGKCYEVHYNEFMQHPERIFIVDICMPVKFLNP